MRGTSAAVTDLVLTISTEQDTDTPGTRVVCMGVKGTGSETLTCGGQWYDELIEC